MTREFWIWQWADGEFGSFIWPSKDSATLPHRHEVGHPIQLVPKTDIETAQKDAPAWHDAPTHKGTWIRVSPNGGVLLVDVYGVPHAPDGARWYGPIPPDGEQS